MLANTAEVVRVARNNFGIDTETEENYHKDQEEKVHYTLMNKAKGTKKITKITV